MTKLFTPSEINGLCLPNRFIRSATWEGMAADDGACTPQLSELMANLAQGGVGLIITSHAYVRQEGQAGPWQLGIYKDDLVPGLQHMVKAVHDQGGKIALQLAHAGYYAASAQTVQIPLAPSVLEGPSKSPQRQMSVKDIEAVAEAFAVAAGRAKKAGFDGVQIHAAHGYLLSQFLSPAFNRRTDGYGGSVQNRARALLEVLQAIRVVVGKDYPILAKLNCRDFIGEGLSSEDSLEVAVMLAGGGINAIELSGGIVSSRKLGPSRRGISSEAKEAYFSNEARAFKEIIDVPLILVGGIRSYHVAERLIEDKIADYVSMCRPFIREPDLINRWKAGDLRKASCISDNQCFKPARDGEGIYCLTEQKERDA